VNRARPEVSGDWVRTRILAYRDRTRFSPLRIRPQAYPGCKQEKGRRGDTQRFYFWITGSLSKRTDSNQFTVRYWASGDLIHRPALTADSLSYRGKFYSGRLTNGR